MWCGITHTCRAGPNNNLTYPSPHARTQPTQQTTLTPQFEDKYWDSLVSTARYQLSPQGRLVFEFTSNLVNVNNPFSKGSQFQLPLPRNVGNLGTAFADVSYMDGTMWIEKLRDTATGSLYYTIYEYVGPCEEKKGSR